MSRIWGILGIAAALCAVSDLPASTFNFTDGATAGFTNGSTNARVGTWNTATASNAAPFNGFIGNNASGPNFSASWAFSYAPITDTITDATLELGIYDIQSHANLDSVASYTEGSGSYDLTSLLNTAANALNSGAGAGRNEYDILTIILPSSTFGNLASGTVNIALALQGPGLGTLGNTTYLGAGIDFSTLTITTQTVPGAPEPGTMLLAGGCLAALIAGRRRLSRA